MPNRVVAAVSVLLVAAALLLHLRTAPAVFSSSPMLADGPAHYTTGVMVHEYVRGGLATPPLQFAESFYVRFPKVALGHWPPVYYALQAAWYFLFGPHLASAVWLSVAIVLATAAVLFRRLRRGIAMPLALGCCAVFAAVRPVRVAAWAVMSDLLTGLFVLLALLAFSELLEHERRKGPVIRFALWSSLAILTKGSAWALGPFALLAPWLARRPRCFRRPAYWLAGCVIVLAAAPFYLWARSLGVGYPVDVEVLASPAVSWLTRLKPLEGGLTLAGPFLPAVAMLGLLDAVRARFLRRDESLLTTDGVVAGAWILAQCLFLLTFPMTEDARVFMPSLAPAVLLFARLLQGLRSAASSLLLVVALHAAWPLDLPLVTGYRAAALAIPYHPGGTVALISSDGYGESAFVAERLAGDTERSGAVLLASHALAASNWSGSRYQLRMTHSDQIHGFLTGLPVRYVVMENAAQAKPHHQLLQETMRSHPGQFRLLGRYRISGAGDRRLSEMSVYENLLAGERLPGVLRVHLGLDRGGRMLEHRWR